MRTVIVAALLVLAVLAAALVDRQPDEAPREASEAAPEPPPVVVARDAAAPGEPPPGDPDRARALALNEEARVELDAGRPADAVLRLESALALSPGDPVLIRNLAYAHYRVGDALLAALDTDGAAAAFARAWELHPDEAGYGLHLASLHLRRYRLEPALELLEAIVARHPESGDAQLMRGDVLNLLDRLEAAIASYDAALEHGDEKVLVAAEAARARSLRQLVVERDYVSEETSEFVVRHPLGSRHLSLLGELQRARIEVCHALGSFPEHKALVVLYPPDSFREVTGTHDWVGGLFDRKIRLPIPEGEAARADVESNFRHEFTHLMVSEWNPRCPTYVNEGLAQVVEHGRGSGIDTLVRHLDRGAIDREAFPRLDEMPESFLHMDDRGAVSLGYLTSYAFVDHVAEQHGLGAVVSWIRQMERNSPADAFRAATGRPLEHEESIFRELVRTARGSG